MSNDKFKNKYRIPSTRLQNWNYQWNAIYFITICTKNRFHYFGEIKHGKMNLSPIGAIADILWNELKNHFGNIELDAFVVMPNHIHGIIIINGQGDATNKTGNDRDGTGNAYGRDNACVVSTSPDTPRSSAPTTIGQQRFQHQGSHSISAIIGSYKSAVTKHAHRLGYTFEWQPRFYDNIIKETNSFVRVQSYIRDNPKKWDEDLFLK